MSRQPAPFVRGQGGYTLVEVIIASAVGMIVMAGLTSVLLTSYRAWTTASSRVEASSQIRSFQLFASDDFAGSALPSASCTTYSSRCVTESIVLSGQRAANTSPPSVTPYRVTYSWDGTAFLNRQLQGGSTRHAASGVTDFWWYLDKNSTVVVSITITVRSYSQTQTLLFYPRVQT